MTNEEIINKQERVCNILKEDDTIREKLNSLIYESVRHRKEYGLEGIILNIEEYKYGDMSLIMRMGCENDTLPYPLNEFLNIYSDNRLKELK